VLLEAERRIHRITQSLFWKWAGVVW
jgi:hypothetical protein